MKKYSFRLEAVLKLRKLNEENCRNELGRMIMELNRIEDQIRHDQKEVENYFKIQESAMKVGMTGSQAQAFPMLVVAKEKNLQLLNRDKKNQEVDIEKKKHELALLRGDLKVIENLKEKDYTDWRKAYNKEVDQRVEEQTQIWLQHGKDKGAR